MYVSMACFLIYSTSCFSYARSLSYAFISIATFLEVSNMIYVSNTTLIPYARWNSDSPLECFGVVRYANNIVSGSSPSCLLPLLVSLLELLIESC